MPDLPDFGAEETSPDLPTWDEASPGLLQAVTTPFNTIAKGLFRAPAPRVQPQPAVEPPISLAQTDAPPMVPGAVPPISSPTIGMPGFLQPPAPARPLWETSFVPQSEEAQRAQQLAAIGETPTLGESGITIPKFDIKPDEGRAKAALKEAANMATGILDFATTDEGVLAQLASLNPFGRRVVSGYFTYEMLKAFRDQVDELEKNWNEMTPTQAWQTYTRLAGTGLMGILLSKHTAKGVELPKMFQPIVPEPKGAQPTPLGLPTLVKNLRNIVGIPDLASENIKSLGQPLPPPTPPQQTPPIQIHAAPQQPAQPEQVQLKPAIKTMDGEVIEGKAGETHNDIIAENKLKPEDIDRREFTDQQGNELSREQAAAARPDIKPEVVPATAEKPAELHSTDLPEAKLKELGWTDEDIADLKAGRLSVSQIVERKLQPFEGGGGPDHAKALAEARIQAVMDAEQVLSQTKMPPPSTGAPSQQPETPAAAPVSEAKVAEAAPSATPPAIAQGDIGQGKAQVGPSVKAEVEIRTVANTEGQKSAKKIKTMLVSELQDAIKSAPSEKFVPEDKRTKVTIDIPGDGVFTIWNTKEAIQQVIDRAKKISTSPSGTVPIRRSGISKEDKAFVEAELSRGKALGPGAQTAGEPPYSAIGQLTDRLKATEPVGIKETVSMRDRITESWAKGKTIAQRALASARSLSESLKDTARGIRKITDVDRRLGTLDWELQESSARSIQAGKAMRDQVKNKTDREAVAIWIDSGGDQALIREGLASLPEGTRPSIRAAVERAANLTPELKQFAQDLKQFFGLREQDAISHEIFEHGLEDYFTHIWQREANMPDSVRAAVNGGRVNDYFKFARERKISMFLEGILQGKVPNLDPADVIGLYNYALDRAIASRKFIRDVADITASDGRPALLPTGTAAKVMEEGTPKALIINPRGKGAEGMDYRTIDHPALRKWKWAGTDENGNPVLYRSDLAVHPEFYERLARIMDRGRLSPTTWGRRLLRASTEVKGFKLGVLSMFHQVHVGSHALWHWTNPFGAREINWDAPETRFAVEKGHLKIAPDPRQMTEFSEGIMPQGLVSKIPFLGPWSKAYSEWTFQDYIPRLKMATFDNAYKRALWMREKGLGFKDLTDEQIAARTGDSVNNAFGELNQWFLGKQGRDPRFQRLLRGIFLAPDFGEARLRFAEKTLTRYGHEERLAMATMLLTMYIGARIANRLTHGDPEWDEKHAFDVKVGEHWWSMRSVAGDINHAVNDFGNFMYVRLNPLYARTASDWLFGRDPRGKKLTLSEKALVRPAEQLIPIQFGGLTRDDQKLWESFVTALGVQTRRDRPDQDVYQLAREWMKASKDPKLLERVAALEQSVFPNSPYAKLRYALQNDDTLAATKAIKELRSNKHTDRQIREAFDPTKPFTGTHKTEPAFKNSLTQPQKELYGEAMRKRWEIKRRLTKAMSIPPTDVPPPDSELPTWDNTSP